MSDDTEEPVYWGVIMGDTRVRLHPDDLASLGFIPATEPEDEEGWS